MDDKKLETRRTSPRNSSILLEPSPIEKSRAKDDNNRVVQQICFVCRISPIASKSLPRRRYLEQTTLFKNLIINPRFRAKLSPPMYKDFAENVESCGKCWSRINEVWGLKQEIIFMQKELDELVEKGRESVLKMTKKSKGKDGPENETKTETTAPRSSKRRKIASRSGTNISPRSQSPPISDHFVVKCETSEDDDEEQVDLQNGVMTTLHEMEIVQKTSSEKSSPTQTRKESPSPQLPTRKSNRMATKRKLSSKDNQDPLDHLEDVNDESYNSENDGHSDNSEGPDFKKGKRRSQKKAEFECSKCGKLCGRLKRLIQHEIVVCKIHHEENELEKMNIQIFPCEVCGRQCYTKTDLDRHILTHTIREPGSKSDNKPDSSMPLKDDDDSDQDDNPTKEKFACSKCGKELHRRIRLISHEIAVCKVPYDEVKLKREGIKLLKCDYNQCDRVFVLAADLRKHALTHTGNKPHTCDKCRKSFTQPTSLRLHRTIYCSARKIDPELRKKFIEKQVENRARCTKKCPHCRKRFVSNDRLEKHVVTAHTSDKKVFIICEFCGKSISSKPGQLAIHIRRVHQGVHRHSCSYCGKGYFAAADLASHVKHNHEKNAKAADVSKPKEQFFCDQCPKTFLSSRTLNDHKQMVHLGVRRFECKTCQAKFYRAPDFKKHVKTHNKPIHKCERCGQEFTSLNGFHNHTNLAKTDCSLLNGQRRRGKKTMTEKQCPHCPLILMGVLKFKMHMRHVHPEERQLEEKMDGGEEKVEEDSVDTTFREGEQEAPSSFVVLDDAIIECEIVVA